MPAVESGWTDDSLNLRVILPGVSEKELKMTVQGNQLFLQGERNLPENFAKENQAYYHLPYGRFERTIDLPNGLDLDNLSARLHDGVLDVRIALTQAVRPKQIPITTGETRKTIAA